SPSPGQDRTAGLWRSATILEERYGTRTSRTCALLPNDWCSVARGEEIRHGRVHRIFPRLNANTGKSRPFERTLQSGSIGKVAVPSKCARNASSTVVPDQLRTGVTDPCRCEPTVQRTYAVTDSY